MEEQGLEVQDTVYPLIESKEYGMVNITPPVGFDRNVGKDWWASVKDLADPQKHPEAYAEAQKHASQTTANTVIKPVTSSDELARQLEKFGQDFISHDKPVRIGVERGSYFMGTYSDGRILISNKAQVINGVEFNPLRELQAAWNNIAHGNKLTWTQEYSIESFWHEIQHNRQKVGKPLTDESRIMMETVNQWYSRRTYQKFMKGIGATPEHQNYIKKHGLGYTRYVRNFDALLTKLKIAENKALGKIAKIHKAYDRSEYAEHLTTWIKKEKPALKPQVIKGLLQGIKEESAFYQVLLDNFIDE